MGTRNNPNATLFTTQQPPVPRAYAQIKSSIMALGIRSPLEVIYFLAFVAIGLNFLISGILINVFQCLMWITIKPFNVWLYRKLNYFCTFAVWGRKFLSVKYLHTVKLVCLISFSIILELQFLAEWWSSSTCLIYTDEKTWTQMGTEHAILLLNHSYEVDWVFSWFLCEQIGTLGVGVYLLFVFGCLTLMIAFTFNSF